MIGALMGGMCFQKGLGAVHGLSHAARLAEAALAASRYSQRRGAAAGPALQRRARPTTNIPASPAPWGLPMMPISPGRSPALNARIGMPADLAEMGVGKDVIPDIAQKG